jgi:hypothetical protein
MEDAYDDDDIRSEAVGAGLLEALDHWEQPRQAGAAQGSGR